MDSNVSKTTFSHKFFKLRFVKEKPTVSVKNLLKQELLQILYLYRQELNIQVDLEFIATILERKIVISALERRQLSSTSQINRALSRPQITSIVYSCPIVSLASYFHQPAQTITENLGDLLASNGENTSSEAGLKLQIEIASSGWINFYLDFKAIASWLERSLLLIETADRISTPMAAYRLEKTPENLFPAQYIHARCCSLLRLGAREKSIALKDANFGNAGWQIEKPQRISWLDEQNLWLTELAEYNLLRQLFVVTDSFASDDHNWWQLALNLSQTTAIFLADCRFLGEVKQKSPQKAIARLGLIALTQYWLQKILLELNVAAPTEL